jgi:glycosyltransferase involved in cell wall biosynthesis
MPPPCSVIPYGVDGATFRPDPEGRRYWREKLALPEDAVVALGVGRMATKKGFQVLLGEIDALFSGSAAQLQLVLAGGGDREQEFRQTSSRWSSRVHFPGLVTRDTLPALYAAADLFVLPAVHDEKGNVDGLPNVILEAMASGLPVVASSISGIPLAVEDEVTGLLVAEGDGVGVARAVLRLARDPALRRRLGDAGRHKVTQELTWDRVARSYAAVYEAALRRAGAE